MPAPFAAQSKNMSDAEKSSQISIMSKNVEKSMKHLSSENPFRLDGETDPFSPEKPSFWKRNTKKKNNNNTNNENKSETDKLLESLHSMPRPCRVIKPAPKWSELSNFEKKEYYLDKKREFGEYLDETFSLRLELKHEADCKLDYEAYQRCLNIKNQWWGGYRDSTGRGMLAQIFFCPEQFKLYNKCLERVDTNDAEYKLREEDQKTINKLFPR